MFNKQVHRMIRFVGGLALSLSFVAGSAVRADATLPYEGYNFDAWGYEVPAPAAYEPVDAIVGADLGIDAFRLPSDIFVRNGLVYVCDAGNNRIVAFDYQTRTVVKNITGFVRDGVEESFSEPSGIFVTMAEELYIADYGNRRVVTLDADGGFIKCLENPQAESIPADFVFSPTKIAVDAADRLYVVARNAFEGIMSFDKDGTFFGYYGTINVTFNPIDYMWKVLSTQEQRSRSVLFIPTEFSNLDIDSEGFIYTTNIDDASATPIKKLNPSGDDVLTNYTGKNIVGDLSYRPFGRLNGPTLFVDVVSRDSGMYTALDATRGRTYTYDSEGNLLYVFGVLGNIFGTFKTPVAVEAIGDHIIVLDQQRARLVVFQPTHYGSLINQAVALRFDGDESAAVQLWQEVLKLDANFQLAYDGIAKSYLAEGDNKAAMAYFKKARNKPYYSVALNRYRSDLLFENISWILSGIVLLTAGAVGYSVYRSKSAKKKGVSRGD